MTEVQDSSVLILSHAAAKATMTPPPPPASKVGHRKEGGARIGADIAGQCTHSKISCLAVEQAYPVCRASTVSVQHKQVARNFNLFSQASILLCP